MWYNSNHEQPKKGNEKTKKPKVTLVEENPGWGLYAWRKKDGKLFMDEDHNLLNIPSRYGDLEKIAIIRKAAAHYGEPEGKPEFIPGVQRATEEEYSAGTA